MFFGFDLKEILMFPFKDQESRKYFLIGCLVALAAFFIPIVPYLVLFGYAVRIARQVMNNESPRMIAWDDWGPFYVFYTHSASVNDLTSASESFSTALNVSSSVNKSILAML